MSNPIIRLGIARRIALDVETLKNSLEQTGNFSVSLIATTGPGIIEQLAATERKPDILVIESTLTMHELDVHEEIKRRWGRIKTMVLKLFDPVGQSERLIKQHVNALVSDLRLPELLRVLQELVEQEYVYTRDMTPAMVQMLTHSNRGYIKLKPQERKVTKLIADDKTYDEIADITGASKRAIEHTRDSLFAKTGTRSRLQLAKFALHTGIL